MSEAPERASFPGTVALRVDVAEVRIDDAGDRAEVTLADYRRSEPDPLHTGAAEQLQHLAAQHPEAVSTLSRLCGREALIGAIRVLPIVLDRYGIVLRVERARDHRDVRLPFHTRIATGAQAAQALHRLLIQATHHRPCGG
jgi:Protein of unknown function (DUF2470)